MSDFECRISCAFLCTLSILTYMSEDSTKNLEQRYGTNPTILTVLERLDAFGSEVNTRLDRIETQLDRATSVAHETRAELRELRGQLRENFPSLVK
jgi:50S ribosomal subunit-associated GTPase HflX